MTVGHFPTTLGARVSAATETERDGEDQKEMQGFLVHTVGRAQGVRAVPPRSVEAPLGVNSRRLSGRGYKSQQLAHAIDRAEINAVRTAPQQLLRH